MTQNIKSKYVAVIDTIAEEHGSDDCHYVVPKDATLAQCIGYAQRYYVEGDEEHHRYNRCRNLLKTAMSHIGFVIIESPCIGSIHGFISKGCTNP